MRICLYEWILGALPLLVGIKLALLTPSYSGIIPLELLVTLLLIFSLLRFSLLFLDYQEWIKHGLPPRIVMTSLGTLLWGSLALGFLGNCLVCFVLYSAILVIEYVVLWKTAGAGIKAATEK